MTPHDVVMIRRGEPGDSPSPVTIHGLKVWTILAERLRAEGHRFVVGAGSIPGDRPVALLWDFGSVARLPQKLLVRARGKVVAWCLESPLVAHRAFHRLNGIAGESATVLTFSGARELIDEDRRDRFLPVMYPISDMEVAGDDTWSRRRFITMINSNKSVTSGLTDLDISYPIRSARRAAAAVLARSYLLRGSWGVPDLYAERVRALSHFSRSEDFDLFGHGWNGPIPGLPKDRRAKVMARYKGVAGPPKREILSNYRFCLCYENTAFPGYITEKIFDCFAAGTIPVYLGAPDVTNFIPEDAFVDTRRFSDLDEMVDYIEAMSTDEARRMLESARSFMDSDRAAAFHESAFVRRLEGAVAATVQQ